jgi:hypothetical protein
MIAMDSLDDERTREIARNWNLDEIEGAVELWRCPTCGRVVATEMTKGVRKDAPILVVTDEIEIRE